MAILKVVKYGDDILRKKTKSVDFQKIQPVLPQLIEDMVETCLSVRGVGLAANQIGLNLRLAVILVPESNKEGAPLKRYVLINPEILSQRGEKLEEEGCLSMPGLWVEIKRATDVTITCLDENGQPQKIRGRGLLAKAFQHEVDHLDGKLCIDHVDPALKPEVKKVMKQLRKKWD